MKYTKFAAAIVALAMVPSSGILGGGVLRPRVAAAGPWGAALPASAQPVATLNGKAKLDLGLAVYLSPAGLGALLEAPARTDEGRTYDWQVPAPMTTDR